MSQNRSFSMLIFVACEVQVSPVYSASSNKNMGTWRCWPMSSGGVMQEGGGGCYL
jgi:hypothetical protein